VRRALARWLSDPDLEGFREQTALDKLTADERTEWLALWKEVGELLNRAEEAK
jgi:hypothetical protein